MEAARDDTTSRDGLDVLYAARAVALKYDNHGDRVQAGRQKGKAAAEAEGRTDWGAAGAMPVDFGERMQAGKAASVVKQGRPKGSKTTAAKRKGGPEYRPGPVGGRPKGSKTAASKLKGGSEYKIGAHSSKRARVGEKMKNGKERKKLRTAQLKS